MPVADLAEGPGCPAPLILGKNEMTEGRKAGMESKTKPASPLSSRSGSDTECCYLYGLNLDRKAWKSSPIRVSTSIVC